MEKRNLYIVIAVALVVVLALSFYRPTGKPIALETLGQCVDTDGGKDYYVAGVASYVNRDDTYPDYCYAKGVGPEKWLKEYWCEGEFIRAVDMQCEEVKGCTACIDGAFVK